MKVLMRTSGILAIIAGLVLATAAFLYFGKGASTPQSTTIDVWSATDRSAMAAILEEFEAVHPDISVRYTEYNTSELHAAVLKAAVMPDVIISIVVNAAMH